MPAIPALRRWEGDEEGTKRGGNHEGWEGGKWVREQRKEKRKKGEKEQKKKTRKMRRGGKRNFKK